MNFVSDAIEFLEKLGYSSLRTGRTNDVIGIKNSLAWMRTGHKFLLPLHGMIGVMKLETEMFKLTRCPYPVMVLEFETSKTLDPKIIGDANDFYGSTVTIDKVGASSKRIVIVVDGSALGRFKNLVCDISKDPDPQGILIQPISYMDDMDNWVPSPIGIWVPRENVVDTISLNKRKAKSFKTFEIPLMLDMLMEMVNQGANLNDLVRDCAEEVTAAINFLIAINARNVKQVTIPAPEKLNKKRHKNKREPFYEYKVLDIFLGGDIRSTPSGRGRRDALIQQWLRSSPKLHTVIGHFKHRKTGIFWWHDHMRGDAHHGRVDKEYIVKK